MIGTTGTFWAANFWREGFWRDGFWAGDTGSGAGSSLPYIRRMKIRKWALLLLFRR